MQTNVQDFFEKARNLPLRSTAETLLVNCPIDFVRVFGVAKQLTLNEAGRKPTGYKERNYMAEVMYGNVIGVLNDNYPDLMRKDTHNRPYILLDNNIRIYIKKLTEAYLPSNIKTKHVTDMNAQELFEDEEQIHVLYAGFVLQDNDWTLDFKEVCICYLNKVFNNSVAWLIDLNLEKYRKSLAVTTYMATEQITDAPLVNVPKQDGKTGTDNK